MRFSTYSAENGGGAGKVDKRKAIKKLKALVLSPKMEPETFNTKLEQMLSTPRTPAGVDCREKSFGGIFCDVLSPEVIASNRLILYIHGGGFVAGSRSSWKSFCSSFAAEASAQLILPEYKLAPQHPYPAALDDIQIVFREVLERKIRPHSDDSQLILAADGSGASLALALVQTLTEELRQKIKSIILISPWIDMNPQSEFLVNRIDYDGVLSVETLLRCGKYYTDEENLKKPLVSPLYVESFNLKSFPPVYIQCGGDEIILDGVKAFKSKLEENNLPCILDIWPEMMFLFQMAHEHLPQAHLAIQRIGSYIQNLNKSLEQETE